ncbi:MAG: pseudouridine synthase [Cytophagales bacterium]|nr:MAG: pseudouridine synthase [Cytophagales bacterium]
MEKKFSNKGRRGSSSSFDKKRPSDKDKSFTKNRDDKPSFRKPSGIRTKQDDKFDVEKFTGVKPRNQGGFKRNSESGFEKKPYEKREGSFNKSYDKPFDKDRPYKKREGEFEKKPYEKREGSFNKSYDKPFDKDRPYKKREGEFEKKPYEKREGSFNKSYDKPFDKDRPYKKREGEFEKKPYEKREGSFNKSYDKPFDKDRPYKKREGEFEKKPYEKREGSFNKSYDKPFDKDRPYKKREGEFEKKPYEKREGSFNKPYEKRSDKVVAFRERKEKSRTRSISTPDYDFQRFKNIEEGLKERNKNSPRNKNKESDFEEITPESSDIRLNRFIANAGVCSRREADVLIEAGRVKINGSIMKEMGYRVKLTDSVYLDDEPLKKERVVYVLLNKPKDHITTTDDPEGRKTVMNLVKQACNERIYPVGRLDRNTTGLLLMTNDGLLADKLAHPSNNIKKVYQILLAKPITEDDFNKIAAGVTLEDGEIKVDKISIISEDATALEVHIHSGKNRIVRRIFEHFEYDILRLDRVAYAGITKKGIERGEWRYLTEQEVIRLKYFVK